jgi:hypothetical protein
MLEPKQQDIARFIVSPEAAGRYSYYVFQQGFEIPIAEFSDMNTAERYALRIAETKSNWIVETYNTAGTLVGTYNSEDDSMPKPLLDAKA